MLERRQYPELATREPAEDDEEVFGPAWPLIVERRELKESHPNKGKSLSWLVEHERLMEVEVGLLEEHGLTLPPEKQPLRGLDRGRSSTGEGRRSTTLGGRGPSGSCSGGSGAF